jgi:predicted esterase YcpF (UPF0227 family)
MKILYIHGFNSAGYGEKINHLREAFKPRNVVSPTLHYDPEEAMSQLEFLTECMKEKDQLFIFGTSLGGFYALYLSYKYKVPSVLINPSIDPYQSLSRQVGPQKNFKTDEDYVFTKEHLKKLKNYYIKDLDSVKDLVYVYLDEEDELLDSKKTAEYFKGFHVVMYPGGNHRFTHMKELIEDFKKILEERWKR